MSESILKALMRLFAIVANVNTEEEENSSRNIVEAYLKQMLNEELLKEYLSLFDEFVKIHHRKKGKKRISSNSVKVLAICEQINEELRQEQKMLVLLQLLEYISYVPDSGDDEMEFVQTVAGTFNIPDNEYKNIKAFILDSIEEIEIPQRIKILIVSAGETSSHPLFKHINLPGLEGKIYILHIESTDMYIFRYKGKDQLSLNGQVIKPNWGYLLVKGSTIRGKKIKPLYFSDIVSQYLQEKTKSKIVFNAENIDFRFRNGNNGIRKFTFSEETGRLIGIMGGSGAGKSTLLNIFNGNIKPQQGTITINGYDIYRDKDKLKGVIGFVPQDDLLIEELTVYQNLYYNAKLCFDNFTEEELQESIKKTLLDLDLYEIKDLKVGGVLNKFISGGQRKRLNIALELIREPAVLFVDEPTSGLSSMDSEMVMDLLKEQSLKGKLVIINIHQPASDIYKLFDNLLILDKGGHIAYYGNPIDAIIYFKKMTNHVNAEEGECTACGNVNPEQVLEILEAKVVDEYGKLTRNRKTSPKEWYKKYNKNIAPNIGIKQSKDPIPETKFKIPGAFKQFSIFIIRDVLSKFTNKQYLLINFLEAPLLAVILGYFTKYIAGEEYVFNLNENLPAYLFMAVVVSLFLGLTVSAEEIIKDRKILQREAFLNLSKTSYINSKVLILFVISAIQSFSFVLIGNFILGISGMNIQYFLILFTGSAFANMLGLNISAGLNSVVTIYILIPFILVPQLLLSGVIVKFDKLHKSVSSYKYVPFAGDMMTSRWMYEALVVTQYKNNKYEKHFFEVNKKISENMFKANFLIPELKSQLTKIEKSENSDGLETLNATKLLKNEILKMQSTELNKECALDLDKEWQSDKIREYLKNAEVFFTNKLREYEYQKDGIYSALYEKYGKEAVMSLKDNYHNQSVTDICLNNQEINKYVIAENEIIQTTNPIYKTPDSNIGRAHFYAPVKIFYGKKIDTYYFNILFIWFTTLLLYFALQTDALRKLLNYLGNIKFRK